MAESKRLRPNHCRWAVDSHASVVLAFFLCWAPFHTQRLMYIYAKDSPYFKEINEWMYYITGILYYVSSTVNPILYNVMSAKYRVAFRKTLCLCMLGPTNNDDDTLSKDVSLYRGETSTLKSNGSVMSRNRSVIAQPLHRHRSSLDYSFRPSMFPNDHFKDNQVSVLREKDATMTERISETSEKEESTKLLSYTSTQTHSSLSPLVSKLESKLTNDIPPQIKTNCSSPSDVVVVMEAVSNGRAKSLVASTCNNNWTKGRVRSSVEEDSDTNSDDPTVQDSESLCRTQQDEVVGPFGIGDRNYIVDIRLEANVREYLSQLKAGSSRAQMQKERK
uniref:G-protein coupled receptors family 1 profile domain-containing protein n=1 Tax=Timema genevievae TaxID=629358 RepID=A0A7R9K538_TIMGE|nr:unnamed protein product [Timema genevievae]